MVNVNVIDRSGRLFYGALQGRFRHVQERSADKFVVICNIDFNQFDTQKDAEDFAYKLASKHPNAKYVVVKPVAAIYTAPTIKVERF